LKFGALCRVSLYAGYVVDGCCGTARSLAIYWNHMAFVSCPFWTQFSLV
jgi:hypothetical protein